MRGPTYSNNPPKENDFGWRSACFPTDDEQTWESFSMSFFQWQTKSSKKGLKEVPIPYRLSGPCRLKGCIVTRANQILKELAAGWRPTRKSESIS